MNKKTFYITTTLPYVNAPLHLGHATEIIRADAVTRYKKLMGYDVFFNTGTDEHGLKIFQAAEKAGKDIQKYVDECAVLYKDTLKQFGISEDTHYVRTTDERHIKSAQEFWRLCDKNGYIYKKNYQTKYCVGCEEEKTDSDLVDGKCPIHSSVPELIDEENYFFKFSAFGDRLLELYEKNPNLIIPTSRMNEMREFIKRGLRDFSISRLKSKMSWGIEVPGDSEHVMYVWFDALTNYISTLDWLGNGENFKKYWEEGTPVQYCGKDNTRFQGVMWQAMLMAAGVTPTHTIVVDGFILGEGGVKMSKSLGNIIDPLEIIKEYGTDALRYFILKEFHPFEDTAVSKDQLKEWYNAGLANGIGNLTSRIMKMVETNKINTKDLVQNNEPDNAYYRGYKIALESFDLKSAFNHVYLEIVGADRRIQSIQPFKLIKQDLLAGTNEIIALVKILADISYMLRPLLPETANQIDSLIKKGMAPEQALFVRK
jgi:methionyl-tRNA synthetase